MVRLPNSMEAVGIFRQRIRFLMVDTRWILFDKTKLQETIAEAIPGYNLITFDIKPTLAKGYLGITFRADSTQTAICYDGVSYLLWINVNSTDKDIELQKNPAEDEMVEFELYLKWMVKLFLIS